MANYENQLLVGGLVIALAVFVLYSGDEDQAKAAMSKSLTFLEKVEKIFLNL